MPGASPSSRDSSFRGGAVGGRRDEQPLRHRTLTGAAWVAAGQFGAQGIHYVALLILAWWLEPADFGVVSLAMIFVLLTQGAGELGLAAAIVREDRIDDAGLSTAFWISGAAGVVLGGTTFAAAEAITGFLGEPNAGVLLRMLSPIFPLASLAVVPRALLLKELGFQRLAGREFASELAFAVVGIGLAVGGAGAYSLAGAVIAQRLAGTLALWAAVRWRPGLTFEFEAVRRLLTFGLHVVAASILARGVANADYFVVGRGLGAEALGYYTLAFQLVVTPVQRLVGVVQTVAFPAFALVREDGNRLRRGFLESIEHLCAASLPFGLLQGALAPWFIDMVYGEKWRPAAGVMQVLAVGCLFYGLDVAETLYLARGRAQLRTLMGGFRLILFGGLAVFVGLRFGIVGVALSLVVSLATVTVINMALASRLAEVGVRQLWRVIVPSMRATVWACIPLGVVAVVPDTGIPAWGRAVGLVAAMSALYIWAIAPRYRLLLSGAGGGTK